MSPTASKQPNENALALYRFLQAEWDAMGIAPTTWCRQVGIPDPTIYRWKTGVEPDMRSLRRVAAALQRPLMDILMAAKYVTKRESEGHVVPIRSYTVLEGIELDKTISNECREALRQVYDVFRSAEKVKPSTRKNRS